MQLGLFYHEAGHAVIAHAVGMRLVRVDAWWAGISGTYYEYPVLPRSRAELLRLRELDITILQAGRLAAENGLGADIVRRIETGKDSQEELTLAFEVCGPGASNADVRAYLDRLYEETRTRVAEPTTWCAIDALASVIAHKRVLSGDEVRAVIKAAMRTGSGEAASVASVAG